EDSQQIAGTFGHGAGLGISRTVLHQHLIANAEACGVRLMWRTPITGITAEGVQVREQFLAARWIVGADGSASRVRRWAGLAHTHRQRQRYAARRHYRIVPWSEYVDIHWQECSQVYVTPVGPQEVCVVVMGDTAKDASFDRFAKLFPELQTRLAGARLSTRERGAVTVMQSLASAHSRNVALLGAGSGGLDPITGDGLRLASRQAAALAMALEQADLEFYNRTHRELLLRPLLLGHLLLTLGRNPRLRARAFRMLR